MFLQLGGFYTPRLLKVVKMYNNLNIGAKDLLMEINGYPVNLVVNGVKCGLVTLSYKMGVLNGMDIKRYKRAKYSPRKNTVYIK
jgi:hypothetical protein